MMLAFTTCLAGLRKRVRAVSKIPAGNVHSLTYSGRRSFVQASSSCQTLFNNAPITVALAGKSSVELDLFLWKQFYSRV